MKNRSWALFMLFMLFVLASLTPGCGGGTSAPDADVVPDSDGGPQSADGGAPDAWTPACESDVECDDDNPCTADRCDALSGCIHDGAGVTTACDDGDRCTTGDVCVGDTDGTCEGTTNPCDDGNACTADSCDAVTGCGHALIGSHACAPEIVVMSPPRGATVDGSSGASTVIVTGHVASLAGAITSFTVGGVETPLGPTGEFETTISARRGGNVLVLEAEDAWGTSRRHVQAFLFSSQYRSPDEADAMRGAVDGGTLLWLGPTAIDDGDRTPPVDDLATVLAPLTARVDLARLYDPTTAVILSAGYDVYVTSLNSVRSTVGLAPDEERLRLTLTVDDLEGDLSFDCPCSGWTCGCWFAGGDGTGGFSASAVTLTADLTVSVRPDGTLAVASTTTTSAVSDLRVWSNTSWTNFLVSQSETYLRDVLLPALYAELGALVTPMTGVLEAALSSSASVGVHAATSISASMIGYDVRNDFVAATVSPSGLQLELRTGAYGAPAGIAPYANLGVPSANGCTGTSFVPAVIVGVDEVEQASHLDAINQQPYAVWRAGGWQASFPVDSIDLSAFPVTSAAVTVSGMLAPTIDDCDPGGDLRVVIGDLRVSFTLDYAGVPVTGEAHASVVDGVSVRRDTRELTFSMTGSPTIELDVVAADAAGTVYDAELAPIADAIVRALLSRAAATPLARVPHPVLDGGGVEPEVPPGSGVALSPTDDARSTNAVRVGGDATDIR